MTWQKRLWRPCWAEVFLAASGFISELRGTDRTRRACRTRQKYNTCKIPMIPAWRHRGLLPCKGIRVNGAHWSSVSSPCTAPAGTGRRFRSSTRAWCCVSFAWLHLSPKNCWTDSWKQLSATTRLTWEIKCWFYRTAAVKFLLICLIFSRCKRFCSL